MTAVEPRPRAYVDESYRATGDGSGAYLLAAVVVPASEEEDLRRALRRARPDDAPRLHWRKDRTATRRGGLRIIAGSETLRATVVISHGVARQRQERARRDAMWNLVFALHDADVMDIVFEARERRQNEKDSETLQRIFAVPEIAGMRHSFGRPGDEPLLWLPDYLVGVIGTHLRGEGDRHLDRLVADIAVTTIDITAR